MQYFLSARMLPAGLICVVATLVCAEAMAAGYSIQWNETYACPDGKTLSAIVYEPVPEPASPAPAVLLIHGGSWLFGTHHQLHWYL